MQDIVSLFVLFLLIVVTFTITAEAEPTTKYNIKEREIFDADIFILNFLKTPVNEGTFRDLIVESHYQNDYADLTSRTQNFFDENNDVKCPVLGIVIIEMPGSKEAEKIFTKAAYENIGINSKEVSSIDIPLREPGKYLDLRVSALC